VPLTYTLRQWVELLHLYAAAKRPIEQMRSTEKTRSNSQPSVFARLGMPPRFLELVGQGLLAMERTERREKDETEDLEKGHNKIPTTGAELLAGVDALAKAGWFWPLPSSPDWPPVDGSDEDDDGA
jgi:hypothetical protein